MPPRPPEAVPGSALRTGEACEPLSQPLSLGDNEPCTRLPEPSRCQLGSFLMNPACVSLLRGPLSRRHGSTVPPACAHSEGTRICPMTGMRV